MTLLDDCPADDPADGADRPGIREAARADGCSPGLTLARLLHRITLVWPELRSSDAHLLEDGGDHLIVLFDENIAIRTPRDPGRDMTLEGAMLYALRGRTELEIPAYDLSSDGRLARYRFIGGVPLTPERCEALTPANRRTVAAQLGAFLSKLHGMRASVVAPETSWPRTWTAAEFADHARRELLPALALRAPSLIGDVERFYRVYEHDEPERLVVVHGDLVHEHMLLRPKLDVLAGIIDFGDVGLGDPAQDVAGLWAFGEGFVRGVLYAYHAERRPEDVMARSNRTYIGNLIHRLGTAALEQQEAGVEKPACAVAEQLQRILKRETFVY